jgi:hypothetical protein
MTAELSRLAEDMLPHEEEEVRDKKARRLKQKGQDSKDLRQRLLDSWDGKVSLANKIKNLLGVNKEASCRQHRLMLWARFYLIVLVSLIDCIPGFSCCLQQALHPCRIRVQPSAFQVGSWWLSKHAVQASSCVLYCDVTLQGVCKHTSFVKAVTSNDCCCCRRTTSACKPMQRDSRAAMLPGRNKQ